MSLRNAHGQSTRTDSVPLSCLNIHFGLHLYSFGIGDFFGPIYFYKIGISLPVIFYYWTLFFIFRLCLRPLILAATNHVPVKSLFLLGVFLYAGSYPLYQFIDGVGWWLLLLLIYQAVASTLYWTLYHAYFASLGAIETRGKQVALRDIIMQIALLAAPVSAGLLITQYGFISVFYLASFCTLLGMIPLLRMPELDAKIEVSFMKMIKHVDMTGFKFYFLEAIHTYAHGFTWKLVVFILIGSYAAYGGLMGIAILLQVVGLWTVGHMFDRGKGMKFFSLGVVFLLLAIVGRTFLAYTVPIIIAFDFLCAGGSTLYALVVNSINYNASRKSHSTVWFQFFAESGWDIGGILASATVGTFLLFGGELRLGMLFAVVGVCGYFVFGRRMRARADYRESRSRCASPPRYYRD